MLRMPLASASLLALAITLAGCGEDKATPPAATAPVASSASALDPAASKAVVAHYAALASATELKTKLCTRRLWSRGPQRSLMRWRSSESWQTSSVSPWRLA